MKLYLGISRFEDIHTDDLLSNLDCVEEVDIPPELILSDQTLDVGYFEKLISADLNDIVYEYIHGLYDDSVDYVVAEVTLAPKARYSLQEVQNTVTEKAIEQFLDETEDVRMFCIVTDNGKELHRSEYDLHSFLAGMIRDREETEQGNIDAGYAIIEGTKQFIDDGKWQYAWIQKGEAKKALMWFGLEGEKSEEGWILNIETDADTGRTWQDYWFNNDWDIRVPDEGGILDYWMGMECGDYLPPMEDVLETCPIEVNKHDDYETLTRKIIRLLE